MQQWRDGLRELHWDIRRQLAPQYGQGDDPRADAWADEVVQMLREIRGTARVLQLTCRRQPCIEQDQDLMLSVREFCDQISQFHCRVAHLQLDGCPVDLANGLSAFAAQVLTALPVAGRA
jgi:hypothetical protein